VDVWSDFALDECCGAAESPLDETSDRCGRGRESGSIARWGLNLDE